jgi:hypothetical protein
MPNEALVQSVKSIMKLGKEGRFEEAYQGYKDLLESPDFSTFRPEDQRQVLRLMILAKGAPSKSVPAVAEAHKAAIAPLEGLVQAHGEPSDYELLGICYVAVGDTTRADAAFRAGLDIERQRNASSDLCGSLMKRISFL